MYSTEWLSTVERMRLSPRKYNRAITPAVTSMIGKLLDRNPSRRYQTAAQLRDDIERHLAHQPLRYAPNRSISERLRKWQRRHPRWAAAGLVAVIATLVFILPVTVLAVRKMQLETTEAELLWQESEKEARTVQVMLATRLSDRAELDRSLANGKSIIEKYGIDEDSQWLQRPQVSRLTSDRQKEVRREFGEMLLLMAQGEQKLSGDSGDPKLRKDELRTALHWNALAANCYPDGQIPHLLVRQRYELLESLPEEANRFGKIESNESAETAPYHEGVEAAMEGRYREALEVLKPFTLRHPRHFHSWFVRGMCHEQIGEYAESAECWTCCIALEPDLPGAYYNRGIVRLKQGDFTQADSDFTRAIELQPERYDAFTQRASARRGLKDYAGAIKDLDHVIEHADAPVRAWFLRATLKELVGQPDSAKADRAEGMKLQPIDELGWSTRGYARMRSEPGEALKDFDEALKLNLRSREALINKSIVLSENLNRPKEAIAVLDRVLEFYPDHHGARAGRGVLRARIGQCDKARNDIEECLKHDRSPFFLFQAAGLYAQISRHEDDPEPKQEALRLLGNALRKGFTNLKLMKTDHDLDPIREEVEFKRLLQIATGLENSPAK